MMRTIFLFVIVSLLLPLPLCAQQLKPLNLPKYDQIPIHFGMSLGFNTMDFGVKHSAFLYSADSVYSVENIPRPGININIVSVWQFKPLFSIRFLPGLNFGQRDLVYWVYKDSAYHQHTMMLESTFLDFPLLLQYKANRYNNFRPYVVAGGSFKIDLAAQRRIKAEEMPKIRLKRFTTYYEVGLGTDFLLEYFKFAIELKYAVGINNAMVRDNSQYTKVIDKLNSKMIMLSFTFEGSDLRSFKGFRFKK